MKIVYEDGELERLEETYKLSKDKGRALLFGNTDPDRTYSLNFKVTNPALAEFYLLSILNNRIENFDLGIDVTDINFDALTDREEVKRKLHESIEVIIG